MEEWTYLRSVETVNFKVIEEWIKPVLLKDLKDYNELEINGDKKIIRLYI
jgi:hypothetical protein